MPRGISPLFEAIFQMNHRHQTCIAFSSRGYVFHCCLFFLPSLSLHFTRLSLEDVLLFSKGYQSYTRTSACHCRLQSKNSSRKKKDFEQVCARAFTSLCLLFLFCFLCLSVVTSILQSLYSRVRGSLACDLTLAWTRSEAFLTNSKTTRLTHSHSLSLSLSLLLFL